MILSQAFLDDIKQADDIYKLIAVCYDKLLEYKDDTDVVFIARAGHLSQDVEYGKSAEAFEDLRQKLLGSLVKVDAGIEDDGLGFENFQDVLSKELTDFVCPEVMDKDTCISLCMFYALEAMDTYVAKNLDGEYMNYQSYGPLNGNDGTERSVVYLQERSSFLSGAYEKRDDNSKDNSKPINNEFRKPLRCTRIGSIFRAVLLVQCRAFHAAIPQIIPVTLPESYKKVLEETKRLRIISIPYIGFKTFNVIEMNRAKPIDDVSLVNGPFYVEYDDNDDKNTRRAIELLDMAIRRGANIIIFPEFIMSGNMLQKIKEHLREVSFADKEQLLLVLAGTNYQYDDQNGGNNILHILNASGYEVGNYYKFSPFLQQSEESFHGTDLGSIRESEESDTSNSISTREYIKNCEILSDPGKECTFVDIEMVGRIQPAICRDVIDGVYTENLANLFVPSILMVPAWSPSVASFDSRFDILARTIHTTSLLCNCCNAVKRNVDKERAIGKLKYPSKKGSSMHAEGFDIMRKPLCQDSCKDKGGCVAEIDIDFSQHNPTITHQMHFATCPAYSE